MSRISKLDTSWPPCGWERLSDIKKLEAQAIVKDPVLAKIVGLTYKIEPIPVYLKNNRRSYIYRLSIDGWKYSIQNKSHEYSILSFDIRARANKSLSRNNFISNIKTKSQPLILNRLSAERTYNAALFMMKQIESGQVLDYNRVLRLYKIHPTQRSLYELDRVSTPYSSDTTIDRL